MNLLLLLSALLSALTGVGQAVRGVRVPAVVCASVSSDRATAPVAVRRDERPFQRLPRIAEAPRLLLSALRLLPAEPIFAGRRRE